MSKKRRKRAQAAKSPNTDVKQPRIDHPSDPATLRPVWSFKTVDQAGPWCFSAMEGGQLLKELVRLGEYEKMNWTQITTQTGSHPVDWDQLAPPAQKRLREIGQDDVDELFSLRMSGNKLRIWGIRNGGVLSILWWDPKHEVCPSKKK